MKKTFHIAKANVLKQKSASASLFIIILIISMLATVGMSNLLGVERNFESVIESSNSLHSAFVMTKEIYNPSFEDVIKNDNRVSQYEITEILAPGGVEIIYGGETEITALIFNFEDTIEISAPNITEEDLSIPREEAIYLPVYAKDNIGYQIGDVFTMEYKNKPIELTVAGFFETNEFSTMNMALAIKFIVPDECYEILKPQFGSSVWVTVRCTDINDSQQFNRDFASEIGVEFTEFSSFLDADVYAEATISPVAIISAIIIIFALLSIVVLLFVIRFRVTNNIENSMHEIGVLKASGYTSSQIIASYVMEYGIVSIPAALLGVAVSILIFPFVRRAMTSTSGFLWSLDADMPVGLIATALIVVVLLIMVLRSCRKIKQLPPVAALRGGIAAKDIRRNHFPLGKGKGNVNTRLGLKNMLVFIKTYVLTGTVIAIMSVMAIIMTVLYQNIAMDQTSLAKMGGFEAGDVLLTLTGNHDADTIAFEIESMPEVRTTSMLDGLMSNIVIEIDGVSAAGFISNDYGRMEILHTHDGALPKNDNEVAIPKIFADQLGKGIGDTVIIKASGISQEYVITGFFSTMSNGGRIGAVTLGGYRQFNPNYERKSITVYLNEGVTFDEFRQKLEQDYGVLNIYKEDDSGKFADSKAVAEEKISNYMEMYDIDSVEYAVIYNDEIILSGSSNEYQIEKITDSLELLKSNMGTYMDVIALVVSVIIILSLIIISMIIAMTMRSIVTKRHRELGTLKALGFTTKQIARQLAISFVPCALIGIVVGCAASAFMASPVLTALFASTGAYGSVFSVNPLMVFMIGALFFFAAFAVASISARRIKDITAYELIADGPVAKKKPKRLLIKKLVTIFVLCLALLPMATNAVYALEKPLSSKSAVVPSGSGQLYGIGSVSKVFTAAAVMKLVDEGKVDLDAPVTAYIPDFRMADARYAQITPRMLLNHSAGLMGMTPNNGWMLGDTYNHDYQDYFLSLLQTQTLKHDPGKNSIYCNDGYTLAEILVERVSGVTFTEFIEINFAMPLGIENIETPQSDFDRARLAGIYMGSSELKPESFNMIGSGGMYSTMEDLCRFATIFMDSANGSVLSKQATDEMAKNQHRNKIISSGADTTCRYGLGWDAVETYPFSKYGIKALQKGGDTLKYHSNLTVLPEYNLAAAVSASGNDSLAQIVAQEIILAVLKEEGLISNDAIVTMPAQNLERAIIPESIKANAGIYEAGRFGHFSVEFTDDTLVITPIMVRNERPQKYIYNTDGEFISTNGDFLGLNSLMDGVQGITTLSFAEDRYLVMQTYEALPGLGITATALPFAEKLESNEVSNAAVQAWKERNDKEYLLVSEKHTSIFYVQGPLAKTLTDDRAYGYVGMGIYKGSGILINMAKIVDETTALGFQSIPTMTGRDTNNLYISNQNGVEYLGINGFRFIEAAAIERFSEIEETIVVDSETIWIDIDSAAGGKTISINTPQNGAWFVYDEKMNCIASSLEVQSRSTIILPENGRIAFAGETGAEFVLK